MRYREINKVFKDINKQLIIFYSAIVLIIMGISFLIGTHHYRDILIEKESELSLIIAGTLSDSINKISFSGKYQTRIFIGKIVKKYPRIKYIQIVNLDGKVLAHSDSSKNGIQIEGFEFLFKDSQKTIIRNDKNYKKIISPYYGEYIKGLSGQIEIAIISEELSKNIETGFIYIASILALLTLLAIFFIYIVSNILSRPIKHIAKLLNIVTDATSDFIFYKDLNHRYLGSNIAFANFINIDRVSIVGFNDDELNIKTFFSKEQEAEVMLNKKSITNRKSLKNRNSKDITLLNQLSPLYDDKNEVFGVVSISRDITKNHKMEQEIFEKNEELIELNKTLELRVALEVEKKERQQRMLIEQSRLAQMGEMIGNIAHQWRQPLNVLGLIFQKIHLSSQRDALDKKSVKKSVDKAMLLINKMSTTIDDFRDFFKPQNEKELFNLENSLKNTISILDASLKYHFIDTIVEIDEKIEIFGFESQFSQVLINIVNNAKDALVEQSRESLYIKISAKVKNEKIVITILDNAGGIDDTIIDKVFNPYFSTKEEGKGIGIGLYMSKVIIEKNMQGSLTVRNFLDGAEFKIELSALKGK